MATAVGVVPLMVISLENRFCSPSSSVQMENVPSACGLMTQYQILLLLLSIYQINLNKNVKILNNNLWGHSYLLQLPQQDRMHNCILLRTHQQIHSLADPIQPQPHEFLIRYPLPGENRPKSLHGLCKIAFKQIKIHTLESSVSKLARSALRPASAQSPPCRNHNQLAFRTNICCPKQQVPIITKLLIFLLSSILKSANIALPSTLSDTQKRIVPRSRKKWLRSMCFSARRSRYALMQLRVRNVRYTGMRYSIRQLSCRILSVIVVARFTNEPESRTTVPRITHSLLWNSLCCFLSCHKSSMDRLYMAWPSRKKKAPRLNSSPPPQYSNTKSPAIPQTTPLISLVEVLFCLDGTTRPISRNSGTTLKARSQEMSNWPARMYAVPVRKYKMWRHRRNFGVIMQQCWLILSGLLLTYNILSNLLSLAQFFMNLLKFTIINKIKPKFLAFMKFRDYVKSLRNLFQKGECKGFVMGNSGADYDSVVGALIYAFYLTQDEGVLYLPLVDCPEADLPLRFEQVKVFSILGISFNELLYSSMVPELWTGSYKFVLYDHNHRTTIKEGLLYEVIDHHAFDPEKVKCNHIINTVGSALTLLYYLFYPELLEKFKGKELYDKFKKYLSHHKDPNKKEKVEDINLIVQLLYYGILIDSYGLSHHHAHLWNEFDVEAVESIQKKIQPKLKYEDLAQAKYDVEQNLKLTFKQQQKKDYKYQKYETFFAHMSTLLFDIDAFEKRYWADLKAECPVQKMKDNEVTVFLFSFPRSKQDIQKSNLRKFILYNAKDQTVLKKVEKAMLSFNFTQLPDVDGWKKWVDLSGRISRKVLDREIRNLEEKSKQKEEEDLSKVQLDPIKDMMSS